MVNHAGYVSQLFLIRNRFGPEFSGQKKELLQQIDPTQLKGAKILQRYYDVLLFTMAYPDNKAIYELASERLSKLADYINNNDRVELQLFNSGVTGSRVCGSFSFALVKWLRNKYGKNVWIEAVAADDGQMTSVISVVMPKVESEILQDANATWKTWLKKTKNKDEELLDTLIRIFDQSDLRPEIKDELWGALGIDITVSLTAHTAIPLHLCDIHYHRSLIKAHDNSQMEEEKPIKVKLTTEEAEQIIESGRMILVRHIREIDPVTFSEAKLVAYYKLSRGLSIALLGMTPERRHPIDSYMGYVAFKNGLPVAYAGSWILFDSGRIGLNIFPSYRGGESLYIFAQILALHKKAYRLKRFSVDPYQIGKDNSDGIKSGAFWLYYKIGFRPVRKAWKELAEKEAERISKEKGYRTPANILRKLADSKLELIMGGNPVRFDAADLSLVYAAIMKNRYGNNRKAAEEKSVKKLAHMLNLLNFEGDASLAFILKNWAVILAERNEAISLNKALKNDLHRIFKLKAHGDEDEYIRQIQACITLRKLMEEIVVENKGVILS